MARVAQEHGVTICPAGKPAWKGSESAKRQSPDQYGAPGEFRGLAETSDSMRRVMPMPCSRASAETSAAVDSAPGAGIGRDGDPEPAPMRPGVGGKAVR